MPAAMPILAPGELAPSSRIPPARNGALMMSKQVTSGHSLQGSEPLCRRYTKWERVMLNAWEDEWGHRLMPMSML